MPSRMQKKTHTKAYHQGYAEHQHEKEDSKKLPEGRKKSRSHMIWSYNGIKTLNSKSDNREMLHNPEENDF